MKKMTAAGLALAFTLLFASNAHAQHYVKSGETMAKIAAQYKMGLGDLISLNPHIKNPNRINVGDYIITRSADKKRDIIDYARSLQDITAYHYGGNNFPYEVDCSAWVQGIYRKFGITLPRVSKDQAKTGEPVTFNELELGDLMFFSTRADKVITHVGIYMGGDFWISNLNEKSDVKILSTWGRWTQDHFLWGTRYKI